MGDGCIIGPMSVVYKDLQRNCFTPYRDMLFQTNEVKSLRKEVDFLKDQLKKLKNYDYLHQLNKCLNPLLVFNAIDYYL